MRGNSSVLSSRPNSIGSLFSRPVWPVWPVWPGINSKPQFPPTDVTSRRAKAVLSSTVVSMRVYAVVFGLLVFLFLIF